jgi:AraC family transcriptional regulator, ethanolamine operon transcriptional activator
MPRTSLAARNYQRYVRKARAYLCDHPGESPGLETLCRVTGVGARTLETAFREVIGLSPLQFSKVRRLNAARHVLANADPEEASVKTVATSHGFFHLGRFARDYKSLFGESPSMTLAESSF